MTDVINPCARCRVNPRNSTLKSYCVDCKRAIDRERYAVKGRKPRETCAKCGEKRTGAHPTYCTPCMGTIRASTPCPRCKTPRVGASGLKSPYCVPCFKDYRLVKTYGITLEQFDAMLAVQDGKCAICRGDGDGKAWHVDHCHDTNRVRGILCALCNRGIGHFRESAELLRSAATYMTEARKAAV